MEIYVNLPEGSPKANAVEGSQHGRRIYTAVAVSFGLLCVLQATLNLTLHLALYGRKLQTARTEERERFLGELNQFCKAGCTTFNNSFYYVSTETKTWEDSRQDCTERGGDLVIINSIEEQEFISSLKKDVWIGLSVRDEEGMWKWVDGTRLNAWFSYWDPDQTSGADPQKPDNCVAISWCCSLDNWNNEPCDTAQDWVCEKNYVTIDVE